jgi:hypothetical protein
LICRDSGSDIDSTNRSGCVVICFGRICHRDNVEQITAIRKDNRSSRTVRTNDQKKFLIERERRKEITEIQGDFENCVDILTGGRTPQ